VETSTAEDLKRRFAKKFMDILVLRLLNKEPLWGYKLASRIEKTYGVKVGPPVIYPLLRNLERSSLIKSREEKVAGERTRLVYEITEKGLQLVKDYLDLLKSQLDSSDLSP
jgi:DNA-binding PadR family transcriptional regulator